MSEETKIKKTKVGVTGAITYDNKTKIKDTLFSLKKKFLNKKLIIISGGRSNGADKVVKKYSLEFDMDYEEMNPAYTSHNLYSIMKEEFYGKNYNIRLMFQRNIIMASYVDYLVVFKKETKDLDIDHLIKETIKRNKKVLILQ